MSVFHHAGMDTLVDVKAPMRDGVHLSADIYLPRDQRGPFPTILRRTPYDNAAMGTTEDAAYFVQRGYAFVAVDCRGRFDSEGSFSPWVDEARDGHDTIEWVGGQPWCDGNVGMHGSSYMGCVQWLAASEHSEYLKCIAPRIVGTSIYDDWMFPGGAFHLSFFLHWNLRMTGRSSQNLTLYNYEELARVLPLREAPKRAGRGATHLDLLFEHPSYDSMWKSVSVNERMSQIKVPILQVNGWYDYFLGGTVRGFAGMRREGGTELARRSGDRRHRFGAAVAEVDEGRDRVGLGTAVNARRIQRGDRPQREVAHGIAQLGNDPPGKLATDTVGLTHRRLVLGGDGDHEIAGAERREDRQRHPRAHALHRLQQAKPVALGLVDKAVEVDVILAHVGFDEQAHRHPRRRQRAQRASRAVDEIADPGDVDDRPVLADRIEHAGKLGDHRFGSVSAAALRRSVAVWWAWQIATANASAASLPAGGLPGSRRLTIQATCFLSAWPVPTTAFLIRLVAYPHTEIPASAGASSTTPRAWPSFSVDEALRLMKISSTAAASGRYWAMIARKPS